MGFASKSKRLELVAAYVSELQKELIRLEQIKAAAEIQPNLMKITYQYLKRKVLLKYKALQMYKKLLFTNWQCSICQLVKSSLKFNGLKISNRNYCKKGQWHRVKYTYL